MKRLYHKNIFLANIHSPIIFCGVIHIYYIFSVTVVLIWIFSVFLCIWNIFSFKIFAQFQFELRWNIIWFAVEKLNGCKCTEFKYCVHLAIELISFFLNRVLNYVSHKMQTFQCIKWLIFFQGKYFPDIICKIDFLRKKTIIKKTDNKCKQSCSYPIHIKNKKKLKSVKLIVHHILIMPFLTC